MPRFFVSKDNITDDNIYIKGEDAYHIARALRMAEGDSVTVCDGEGGAYSCILSRIRDDECVAKIISQSTGGGESPARITLYMGYPKGDKLEQVIQKAVELGACRIVPFESSRCIKRPKAEREEKQILRMQRIAYEAAKQCGRAIIPTVEKTLSFEKMIFEISHGVSLFCYEGGGALSLREVLDGAVPRRDGALSEINVIVGSEGGFSSEEASAARASGAYICNLGPRILRCETAPAYVLSAISYHLEL